MESADDFLAWGYSVLVLGFHGWEESPQEKSCIPVEYVEWDVDWLLAWENGRIQKVGIKGASMGDNMQADVLLLAFAMDDCWPAEEAARRVEGL